MNNKRNQLINEAMENERILTEKRGYSSGITREMLCIFSDAKLEEMNAKTKKNFKEWGWI